MNYDYIILGADGMQGQIVTKFFLKKGYRLLISDLYSVNVKSVIKRYRKIKGQAKFVHCDLRNIPAIISLLKKYSAPIVVNCADMYWNINVYQACLSTHKHCIDLGSWKELTQQQLRMNRKFKKINRIAVTGCGSVPGIGNVMLNYASQKFDRLDNVDVGFSWNSNMKKFVVPFSMKSILEEFTYNPMIMNNGTYISKKPLQISFRRNFRLIGQQRVFMVQHPEIFTFWYYFKKQGLKRVRFFAGFPEHSLEKIYSLIDLGFHSDKPVKLEGYNAKIAPFNLLNPVLKRLKTPPGYTESENLWVKIKGKKDGKQKTILMECLVPPIKGWENSGCNIDTGFPACIIAEMIRKGQITASGSYAPEAIVPVQLFFKELRKCGFIVYENGKVIN